MATVDELACRDLIVECFTEAQRCSRLREMLPISDAELKTNVVDNARAIFSSSAEEYDSPTFRGLIRLVAKMVQKAHSWGTPQGVIDEQTTRIGAAMDELSEERQSGRYGQS